MLGLGGAQSLVQVREGLEPPIFGLQDQRLALGQRTCKRPREELNPDLTRDSGG